MTYRVTAARAIALVALAAAPHLAAQQATVEQPDAAALSAIMTLPRPPSSANAMAAELSVHGSSVVLSWLEPSRTAAGKRHHALRCARLSGEHWSAAVTVSEGTGFFANWADFPSVVEGANGQMLAHWMVRSSADPYAYDVHLARSTDSGATWQPIDRLHHDRTPKQHGFVSIVAVGAGFRAAWLDGRERAEAGEEAPLMSLRSAAVGATAGPSEVLDPDVCSCCQTDTVLTGSGIAVVYRDHTTTEIRDISIVRRTADGWTEPRPVAADGWRMPACPVNGPSAAYGDGRLAVGWFTAAGGVPRVQVAFSTDDGASFDTPTVLDNATPIGRVAVAPTNGGAAVAWLASGDAGAELRVALVTPAGLGGTPLVVDHTDNGRASGFPRLVRSGDDLVLVWRRTGTDPGLCAARIDVDALTR